jgi:hypothetical protein
MMGMTKEQILAQALEKARALGHEPTAEDLEHGEALVEVFAMMGLFDEEPGFAGVDVSSDESLPTIDQIYNSALEDAPAPILERLLADPEGSKSVIAGEFGTHHFNQHVEEINEFSAEWLAWKYRYEQGVRDEDLDPSGFRVGELLVEFFQHIAAIYAAPERD